MCVFSFSCWYAALRAFCFSVWVQRVDCKTTDFGGPVWKNMFVFMSEGKTVCILRYVNWQKGKKKRKRKKNLLTAGVSHIVQSEAVLAFWGVCKGTQYFAVKHWFSTCVSEHLQTKSTAETNIEIYFLIKKKFAIRLVHVKINLLALHACSFRLETYGNN